MKNFWKIVGIVLLTIAAFSAGLGTVAETCTQGAADSLILAPILSLPAYVCGLAILIWLPLPKSAWIAMLPALVAVGYQLIWTVGFAEAHLLKHATACNIITGGGFFEIYDGREPLFVLLWGLMSVIAASGLAWAAVRTLQEKSAH